MKRTLVLALPLILCSCAKPVVHNTPSGKLEKCIHNATASELSSDLASDMLNRNFSISQQTDTMVKGDRPIDNPMAAALFGSRYDSKPVARLVYNLVKTPECIRVVADANIVTNPGSAYEKLTPLNQSQETVRIQELLDSFEIVYQPRENQESPQKPLDIKR